MPSEIQKMYMRARVVEKVGHHAAFRSIADQTGIDADTVKRVWCRAQELDRADARRGKPKQAKPTPAPAS